MCTKLPTHPGQGPFPSGVFVVSQYPAECWPCARAGRRRAYCVRVRGPGVAALLLHAGATRAGVGMLPLSLSLSLCLTRGASRVAIIRKTDNLSASLSIHVQGCACHACPDAQGGWVGYSGLSVVISRIQNKIRHMFLSSSFQSSNNGFRESYI